MAQVQGSFISAVGGQIKVFVNYDDLTGKVSSLTYWNLSDKTLTAVLEHHSNGQTEEVTIPPGTPESVYTIRGNRNITFGTTGRWTWPWELQVVRIE